MANDLYFTNKRNFTAGEISSLLSEKIDFERYTNGCDEMFNMTIKPQGATTRREGFEFLYDLTTLLGGAVNDVKPRIIPFVYSKTQAYILVFFKHVTTSQTRVVFVNRDGLIEDPLIPGSPYVFEFTGIMDSTTMDYVQSNDVLKLVQSGRIPVDFKRLAHDEWEANEIASANLPTGITGWQDPDNWPTKVGYYEQRLVMAATDERPQTVWFSRSGDFEDFIIAVAAADDPLALTLNSGTQNNIEWLSTSRVLLIGTLGDEWGVSGKSLDPLSFSSFSMTRHTQQGSETIKPIMVGPITIFVEHLGRTVSQMSYDYATDSYDTIDLSILAPHLTKRNKIVDWAYQKTPNGIIWCVRDDGVLLGLTLKREHNIVGWHRHETDGKFLSVGCIQGEYETDLFAVVEREIDGVTKWYIEVKNQEFVETDAKYGRFMDSFLEYEGANVSYLEGLDHLEGKTVSILAEGRPYPDQVVTNGRIDFDREFNYIVVGLNFISRVVPTQPMFNLKDGLTHHRQADTITCAVSVKDSSGMYIGTRDAAEDRLVYAPRRLATSGDDTSANLVTRTITIDLPEQSPNPEVALIQKIVIEQSLPLPLTVLGVTEVFYFSEAE